MVLAQVGSAPYLLGRPRTNCDYSVTYLSPLVALHTSDEDLSEDRRRTRIEGIQARRSSRQRQWNRARGIADRL
jgi:hypothetical protein